MGGRESRRLADAGVRDAAVPDRFADPPLALAEDVGGLCGGEAAEFEVGCRLLGGESLNYFGEAEYQRGLVDFGEVGVDFPEVSRVRVRGGGSQVVPGHGVSPCG